MEVRINYMACSRKLTGMDRYILYHSVVSKIVEQYIFLNVISTSFLRSRHTLESSLSNIICAKGLLHLYPKIQK